MIIRGLDNIIAHLRNEHQKNLDEWCERKGLSPYTSETVQQEYRRRNPQWFDEKEYDSTPEGYDDSPDQGVHRFDGGGTFF